MNLDQLQVFLAVARHLHFSRASEELYITQPAVSAAVAKLESRYGVRLFHRIGRRVELTDAGRFLAHEGRHLSERVDLLERGLQEFAALRRGVLTIGASLTVGNYWLPTHLHAFRRRYSDIELRCSLGNAEQVLDGTSRGRYDLCFLTGWPEQLDPAAPSAIEGPLAAQRVGSERLLVVVGRQHPWFGRRDVDPADLPTTPWVCRERGSGAQRLFEALLADVHVDLDRLEVALVLCSGEMVKSVVLAGTVAAALPESMVRQELSLRLLQPVTIRGCGEGRQPIWMVKHTQRFQSALISAFEEVVREACGDEAGAVAEG
jgi:DNA-binding transcriptional LysR family regulator